MKLPAYYRNLPVAQKLQWTSMIVGITAMLVASGSLLIDEQIVGREGLRRDLGVLADIFSANSTAALTFSDAEAARELLATLHLNQHITTAFLYAADGKPIATYRREPAPAEAVPASQGDRSWIAPHSVHVSKNILNGTQKSGR